MKRALAYVLPSLSSLFFFLVFFGALGLGPRMMNVDGDLGRHLTIGAYILDHRTIPLQDIFSHTMSGVELTPHEWLSQVLFALSYRWLGLNGPVYLAALVIALAISLSFRQALARSGSVLAALILGILAMAASSLHWLTRPHVFTFLCLVLWGIGLEGLRHGKARWYGLPLLMLLWANLHGAFVSGFLLWGLYGLGYCWERWIDPQPEKVFAPGFGRKFVLLGGVSFLATLVNPAGFKLWSTSLGYVGNSYLVGHTAEYFSPDFHNSSTWPFLLLLVLGLAFFGMAGRRRSAVDAAVFIAFAGMSLISTRNIPLFSLLSAPLLAVCGREVLEELSIHQRFFRYLTSLDGRITRVENSLRGVVWPAVGLLLAWAAFSTGSNLDLQQKGNHFDPAVFPVKALDWLEKNPQNGAMFNYFPWGGYILYREWPGLRVFIDGQTDFYGEALTREYERVLTVQDGWQETLAKYQVMWALVPPAEPLAKELKLNPAWRLVYQDPTAVLYVKR